MTNVATVTDSTNYNYWSNHVTQWDTTTIYVIASLG